jgi:4-carboxymuconolactone decarboxylase
MSDEDLNEEQKAFLDQLNEGPRGSSGRIGLVGPYGVWVRAPHVGEPAQRLGAALRFGTELPENVKEVAICTVGAFYRAKFEFAAHRRLALRAGVSEAALDQLQAGESPSLADDEALAHSFADEMLHQHRVSSGTYERALESFGETGLIELVSLIGYYCLISHTLNVFDVELMDGMVDPFPDAD